MSEESKSEKLPDFHLSPWDILVHKLNLIEKGQENLERQVLRLEQRFEREINGLREEVKEIKNDVRKVEERLDRFDQWLLDRAKNERHNFLVLELTMILGFIAVIITVVSPYLVALIRH